MNMRFIFEKLRATRPSFLAGTLGVSCSTMGFSHYLYSNQNTLLLPGDTNRPFNFKESLRLTLQNGEDNTPGNLKKIFQVFGLSASFAVFSKKPYQLVSAGMMLCTWDSFLSKKLNNFILFPVNPIQFKYSSQTNLINNIITKLNPSNANYIKAGVCMGVSDEWTAHEEKGEDLVTKINCADIQDINLMKSICQKQMAASEVTEVADIRVYAFDPGESRFERAYKLTSAIYLAVNDAMEKPDTTLFVSILPQGNLAKRGHRTGLRVKKENNVLEIKFFDVNAFEATFNHQNDAARSVAALFRFGYKDFFQTEKQDSATPACIVTHRTFISATR